MLRERILNHFQQCRRFRPSLDLHFVQELDHQPCETLIRSRDANTGVNVNQNVLGGLNIKFQQTGLVQRAVQEGQHFLVQNIGTKRVWILAKFLFAQFSMVVTIQKLVDTPFVFYGFQGSLVQEHDDRLLLGLLENGGTGRAGVQWC